MQTMRWLRTTTFGTQWNLGGGCLFVFLLNIGLSVQAQTVRKEDPWKKHVVAHGFQNATAVAADFSGDGKVDVITNGGGRTLLYVAPDWREVVIDAAKPPRNCIHSAVIDVDRDGLPDFVGANYSGPGLIFWLRNPGDVTSAWEYHTVDNQVDGIHGLLVGDIDGDGQPDLAANSAQPKGEFRDSLVWYRVPRGAASKQPWPRFVFAKHDAPGLSHYLGLGDVNGDGRVDGASGAKGGPTAVPGTGDWFAWWEASADPTGVWKKHLLSDKEPGATNIMPADLNGDGKTDFFATRGHDRGVLWFEGPKFTRHMIDVDLFGPHCLELGDIDGDGDIDGATCAKDDQLAVWYENDGHGKFTPHVIAREQAAYDIRLIDMDGDKDLDVLIAGQASQNVVWLENPTER